MNKIPNPVLLQSSMRRCKPKMAEPEAIMLVFARSLDPQNSAISSMRRSVADLSVTVQFGVAHRTNAPPFVDTFDLMEQEAEC